MFTCASRSGSRVLTLTLVCAAWCEITCGCTWPTRRSSPGPSQMSSSANCAPAGTFSRLPLDRLSITQTSWPRARAASARWLPMNPAPPVTMIRIYET
jgi:hypothetical protein